MINKNQTKALLKISKEKEAIQEEVEEEVFQDNPIIRSHFHGRKFFSRSKGKGKKRKNPRTVFLFQYGHNKRWTFWSEKYDSAHGGIAWDKMVTEIYGIDFCNQLCSSPGDYLMEKVVELLSSTRGKF